MMMMMMMMIQTMERQKDIRIKLLSSFSSNTIFSFAGGNTAAPWLPIAPFQPRLKGKAGWDPTLTAHFSSKIPLAFEKWCPLVIHSFCIHHGIFGVFFSYIFLFRSYKVLIAHRVREIQGLRFGWTFGTCQVSWMSSEEDGGKRSNGNLRFLANGHGYILEQSGTWSPYKWLAINWMNQICTSEMGVSKKRSTQKTAKKSVFYRTKGFYQQKSHLPNSFPNKCSGFFKSFFWTPTNLKMRTPSTRFFKSWPRLDPQVTFSGLFRASIWGINRSLWRSW